MDGKSDDLEVVIMDCEGTDKPALPVKHNIRVNEN